jgi:hypothetical protein
VGVSGQHGKGALTLLYQKIFRLQKPHQTACTLTFASFSIHAVDFSRPTRLCGKCLLGWTIPAFRQGLGEWEFGLVEQFENDKHRILFEDEEREWVIVEVSPFETYIQQFKKVQAWSPPHLHPPNDAFHTPERSDTTTLNHTITMKPMALREDSTRLPIDGDFEITTTTPPLNHPLSSSRIASLEKHNRQPKSPPSRPIFRSGERPYRTPESSSRAYANSEANTRYGYHPHRASPRTPRSARVSNKIGSSDRDPRQNTNTASPDNSIARQWEERRKASQRLWTIEVRARILFWFQGIFSYRGTTTYCKSTTFKLYCTAFVTGRFNIASNH